MDGKGWNTNMNQNLNVHFKPKNELSETEIKQWKQRYNEYLLRHCKAEIYLNNNNISVSDREKWLPEYRDIVNQLNFILSILDEAEIKYNFDNILGGFDIEEAKEQSVRGVA